MTNKSQFSTDPKLRPFAPLRPGDRLAVVAPASPVRPEELAAGLAWLADRGFQAARPDLVPGPQPYLVGQDLWRAENISAALADPEVQGAICLRGGYGCLRAAEHLDFGRLAALAKPVVGFSDCTVLLCGLLKHGLRSIHGPNLAGLPGQSRSSQERFLQLLLGRWAEAEPLQGRVLAGGATAEGFLAGGNLTVLSHLAGTPWQPPTAGGIVFLEDVHEKIYRLDRCLTHLLLAGFFQGVRGVAVGRLDGAEYDQALGMIAERLERFDIPILAGLPFGHGPENLALLVGGRARLDPASATLSPLGD